VKYSLYPVIFVAITAANAKTDRPNKKQLGGSVAVGSCSVGRLAVASTPAFAREARQPSLNLKPLSSSTRSPA